MPTIDHVPTLPSAALPVAARHAQPRRRTACRLAAVVLVVLGPLGVSAQQVTWSVEALASHLDLP